MLLLNPLFEISDRGFNFYWKMSIEIQGRGIGRNKAHQHKANGRC